MQKETMTPSEDMSQWKFVLGDYACLKDEKVPTLVIALDVSGSMSTAIKFLKSFLEKNQQILTLFGIKKLLLSLFSDYDNAPLKVVEYNILPNPQNAQNTPRDQELSPSIKKFVQLKFSPIGAGMYKPILNANDNIKSQFLHGTPMSLLETLEQTPHDVFSRQNVQPMVVSIFKDTLKEYMSTDSYKNHIDDEQHEIERKYGTMEQVVSKIKNEQVGVVIPFYATVPQIIQFLDKHVKAAMIGTGGDSDEAHATAAAHIAHACRDNPGNACVIFISDACPHNKPQDANESRMQREERNTLRKNGVQNPTPYSIFECLHKLKIPVVYITQNCVIPNAEWMRFPTNLTILNQDVFENESVFMFSLIEALNFFFNGPNMAIAPSSSHIMWYQRVSDNTPFTDAQGVSHISDVCSFFNISNHQFNTDTTSYEKGFYFAMFISKNGIPVDNTITYEKVLSMGMLTEIHTKFPNMTPEMVKKYSPELYSYLLLESYLQMSKIRGIKVTEYSKYANSNGNNLYNGTLVSNTSQLSSERAIEIVKIFISLVEGNNTGAILAFGLENTRILISQFFMAKRSSPQLVQMWSQFKNTLNKSDSKYASLLSILFDSNVTKHASRDQCYINLVKYLVQADFVDMSNLPQDTLVIEYNGTKDLSIGKVADSFLKFINPSSIDCIMEMFKNGGWKLTTLGHVQNETNVNDESLTQEEVNAIRASYPIRNGAPECGHEIDVDINLHTPKMKEKLMRNFRLFIPVPSALFEQLCYGGNLSNESGRMLLQVMQLSLGMAFKENYVPSLSDTLKFLSAIAVHGTNERRVDVQYRMMASLLIGQMLPKTKTMSMFFESPSADSNPNMEAANWWTTNYAIEHLTLPLLELINADKSVMSRFRLIARVQKVHAMLGTMMPSVEFKTTHDVDTTEKEIFVWGEMCTSGHIVPSSFINRRDLNHPSKPPITCVYCTLHPPMIEEISPKGDRIQVDNPLADKSYHNDGTLTIAEDTCQPVKRMSHQLACDTNASAPSPPLFMISIDARPSLNTKCTKCDAMYSILDVRKLSNMSSLKLRCVSCRKGSGSVSNPEVYTKKCIVCSETFVFASDVVPPELSPNGDDTFHCASCYNAEMMNATSKRTVKVPLSCQTHQHVLAYYINRSFKLEQYLASVLGLTTAMIRRMVMYYLDTKQKKLYLQNEFIPLMHDAEYATLHEQEKSESFISQNFTEVDFSKVLDAQAMTPARFLNAEMESLIEKDGKGGKKSEIMKDFAERILDEQQIHEVIERETFEGFQVYLTKVMNSSGQSSSDKPKVDCNMCTHCEGSHEWTDVFSPCGDCSFRVCCECFHHGILKLDKGETVRGSKFRCLCTKPISKDVLVRYVASDVAFQACRIASTHANPSRMGIARCIGGAHGHNSTFCVGRRLYELVAEEERRNGCCAGPDTSRLSQLLEGENDYMCMSCEQHKRKYEGNVSSLMDMTDEQICAIYEIGTPLRKCPHDNCGFPQEFWFQPGGTCGHVECQKCGGEYCFVCGERWTETHAIMHDDMEDYYTLDESSVFENLYNGSMLYGTREN